MDKLEKAARWGVTGREPRHANATVRAGAISSWPTSYSCTTPQRGTSPALMRYISALRTVVAT